MFAQAVLFSYKMFVGMLIGTPNINSFYKSAYIISTSFFVAVNSDPNVDAFTEFCLLINQIIGAMLQNNKIPV